MKPLKNMKVLDFSKVLAGPLCARYLGELGAEVIKIEMIGTGDDTRSWLPQQEGQSAVFVALNYNKKSLVLDLKSAEGISIVHQLVKDADIVIQGFNTGVAERLRIDYETLKQINSSIIYCDISGYGRHGPLGKEPGYDAMLQAFSGMVSTLGEDSDHLVRASFSPVDIGTAMFGFSGILAAVIERQNTGESVLVELSLLNTALGFMTYMAQSYWQTGINPKPMGTAHPTMAPYQAFDASNGKVMIGAGNDKQWQRFCVIADLGDYVNHPDFATNFQRVKNLSKTTELVQSRIKLKTVEEWIELLRQEKIPCAPIHSLGEALTHPQVQESGLLVKTKHPVLGEMQSIGLPITFQSEANRADMAAPLLGEHSYEILESLGYGNEQIAQLNQQGIVQCAAE